MRMATVVINARFDHMSIIPIIASPRVTSLPDTRNRMSQCSALAALSNAQYTCPICLETKVGKDFCISLNCSHMFCIGCIAHTQTRHQCMICRGRIDTYAHVREDQPNVYRLSPLQDWSNLVNSTSDPINRLYNSRRTCVNCNRRQYEKDFVYYSFCDHVICKNCTSNSSVCPVCGRSLMMLRIVVRVSENEYRFQHCFFTKHLRFVRGPMEYHMTRMMDHMMRMMSTPLPMTYRPRLDEDEDDDNDTETIIISVVQ